MICAHHKLMARADRATFLILIILSSFFERITISDTIWTMSLLAGSTHMGAANWLILPTIPTFITLSRDLTPRLATASHPDIPSFARVLLAAPQAGPSTT